MSAASGRGRFQGGAAPAAVAVVVVSYEAREALLACLRALGNVVLPLEVVVLDNASHDGSAAAVREKFPLARLMEAESNLGFGRACNRGWRATRAPYVLFINPDAEVQPGAVETLATTFDARADVGLAGPRTSYPDGRPQISTGPELTPLGEWRQRRLVRGVDAGEPWALREAARRVSHPHEPAWVSGSCLLARREVLEAIGGFDEDFFLYEEDVDLCRRARRAGWRVLFVPGAAVVHRLGTSMARAPSRARIEYDRSHLLYYRKHNGPLLLGLLRLQLLVSAAARWLLGIGDGAERARAAARFRLALRGR